jgi:arsenite/tail-anchored protein-transporting ATPase
VRVLLFTGKGGVGKTSVAAATALRAARDGARTLVMSTDPAHSLADALDLPLGSDATSVTDRLDGQQIDAQQRLEDNWRDIQSYLVALLSWGGVGEVEAEELAVVPGIEEIFSLIDVQRHVESGRYDLLVVDCAPTAETLRLLALPDALGWYMERIFPVERKLAQVVRPVLGRMTSMPMPEDRMMSSVETLYRNLEGVRDILGDRATTSVRLVVNAEKIVIAEAQRTYTYLSLFGYHVDAVIANRLLPDEVADPYFARWKALQAEHLAVIHDRFAGLPVLTAPLFDDELVGAAALHRLADAVYDGRKPAAMLADGEPLRFDRDGEGYELDLALPFVAKGDVDLFRRGDELYVKVGSYTRSIVLPVALRRCDVGGAQMTDGRLLVRFAPPEPEPERRVRDLPR